MSALPTFQRLTYSGLEPSQAFDVIYGGHFEHRLLAAVHATLEHQRLVVGDIRLETGRYDFPVIACGAMPRDAVCIGLVADGIETTRYNTAAIAVDEIQIYPQGVDLMYHAASASRWITITVPESRLQEVAIACTGRPLALPRRDGVSVQLSRGGRRRLVQLADDAFAIGRSLQPDGLSIALASEIARGLVNGYVEALGDAAAAAGGAKQSSAAARAHFSAILLWLQSTNW